MTQEDWVDLLQLIPADQHNQLVVMSQTGIELAIDLLLRTETSYFVFRGRVCGNTDEGRVFFFPYDQVNCVYINRSVKEHEVDQLFTDSPSHSGVMPIPAEDDIDSIAEMHDAHMTSLNPTPLLVPPATTSGSGLVPRVTVAPMPAIKLPPNVTPGALPANPRSSNPMLPPITTAATANGNGTGETPTPKGSILERLRAQRNASQNKPR